MFAALSPPSQGSKVLCALSELPDRMDLFGRILTVAIVLPLTALVIVLKVFLAQHFMPGLLYTVLSRSIVSNVLRAIQEPNASIDYILCFVIIIISEPKSPILGARPWNQWVQIILMCPVSLKANQSKAIFKHFRVRSFWSVRSKSMMLSQFWRDGTYSCSLQFFLRSRESWREYVGHKSWSAHSSRAIHVVECEPLYSSFLSFDESHNRRE